jgi:hypothetical protein
MHGRTGGTGGGGGMQERHATLHARAPPCPTHAPAPVPQQPALNDGGESQAPRSSVTPDLFSSRSLPKVHSDKVRKALEDAFTRSPTPAGGGSGHQQEEGAAAPDAPKDAKEPEQSWQSWLAYFQQADAAAERAEDMRVELKVRAHGRASMHLCVCLGRGCCPVCADTHAAAPHAHDGRMHAHPHTCPRPRMLTRRT